MRAERAEVNGDAEAPCASPRGALDRRLLHYARATRGFLVLSVVTGIISALLVVAQAWLIATVVAGAFLQHRRLATLEPELFGLLCVVVGRAVLAWGAERLAHGAAADAKSDLRRAALEHVAALGPAGLEGHDEGRLAVLLGTGIDALDDYFARYLPQLFLAVTVPVAVVVAVAGADWVSAAIIAVTVPLVPLLMALVGATTGERTARRMRSLERLAGHFLDVVAGLPTLKVFGRAKVQARAVAEVTERYRSATLATLKLTFLSSLVLELLATLSVALVAVAVGLRLLGGHLSFEAALFALVLAPEAYLPLRLLGANYHASADGMKAAAEVFDLIEGAPRTATTGRRAPLGGRIVVSGLTFTYPTRETAALHGLDLVVEPGTVVAIAGPSGCGKSTLLDLLLGLRRPDAGEVTIGGVPLGELDLERWWGEVAWVPQRPHLFARSLADNVRLGRPGASTGQIEGALEAAGLEGVVARLPAGLDTHLGEGGWGLSAGERQRLALARAFVRDAPVLFLDEPTANLDPETEAGLLDAVERLVAGRTALVVAHRPALSALAESVVTLAGAPEVSAA